VSGIADNVKRALDMAAEAAIASGRRPEDVTFLAASKMNSAERVREAYDAGIRFFGENRVQEMTEKNALGAYEGAELHFIGHLQQNKVKNVVGTAKLIHSVDSLALAQKIGARAAALGLRQRVLLEVNIGGEASKSGVEPEALDELAAAAGQVEGLAVEGLMTIPPVAESAAAARRYFERMYQLFVDIRAKKYDNINMYALSMGMSADFPEAIRAGATIVRVGTAVFGERNYN